MRKLALIIAVLGLSLPSTASAACYTAQSSISNTCENGVQVYRGTPMAAPSAPAPAPRQSSADQVTAQRIALQNERFAAQSERLNALQSQLDDSNRSARRSRYGRRYYAPIGVYGGRGIRSRRGLRRGGYHLGGHRGIRVTYNRRRL